MPEVVAMHQYHECAGTLVQLPGVRAADVIESDARLDRPSIEVTIGPGYERVPPRVLGVIRDHDFGIDPSLSGSQGQPRHWKLVVV